LARILVITSGITSVVNSSLALALRLRKDNHEVSYGSFSNIESTITSANLPFLKLPNLQKLTEDQTTSAKEIKTAITCSPTLFGIEKYDLSIIDIECHEFIVSSPIFSKKLILLSTFLSLWRRPGLIPLHLSELPSASKARPCNTFLIWFHYISLKMLRNRLSKLKKFGKDRISNLEMLAIHSGFPWNEKKDETQWLKPVFYKDIAVLNLNDCELDFPHAPNSHAHYVGPMFNIDSAEIYSAFGDSEKNRLQIIFDKNKSSEERSLVYCAFGRFKKSYDDSLIQRILDAAAQRPGWDFLISFGGHELSQSLKKAPSNVHLFRWLPQMTVLLQSDCAVIHSGISSINECINARVPMVLYSLGIRDQEGNAARVAFHKLGVIGNRDRDSSEDLESNILMAMQSDKVKQSLAKFNKRASYFQENRVLENTVNRILRF